MAESIDEVCARLEKELLDLQMAKLRAVCQALGWSLEKLVKADPLARIFTPEQLHIIVTVGQPFDEKISDVALHLGRIQADALEVATQRAMDEYYQKYGHIRIRAA